MTRGNCLTFAQEFPHLHRVWCGLKRAFVTLLLMVTASIALGIIGHLIGRDLDIWYGNFCGILVARRHVWRSEIERGA